MANSTKRVHPQFSIRSFRCTAKGRSRSSTSIPPMTPATRRS